MPSFRGTLGYGNEFARKNVQCQGIDDLTDITDALECLKKRKIVAPGVKFGIFGGSYGGYMTMKSICGGQGPFSSGVAMYGFSSGRWMSYETGDFTYEDEYGCHRDTWPAPDGDLAGDVFPFLSTIVTPCLLLHGLDDNICPPSQSRVVYQSLVERSIPTGLVEYPGEGHGFEKTNNRKDRDQRTLAWFLATMPPDDASKAAAAPAP